MYKIGDLVICKRPVYAGLSRYWIVRLFEKTHQEGDLLIQGEGYYILELDKDGIPNRVSMFTERMYKEKGVKFSDELKKQTYYSRSYSINCIGWSGSDNKKKRYFQKHFYSSLKEMRRSKLKRINFLSEEKHEI